MDSQEFKECQEEETSKEKYDQEASDKERKEYLDEAFWGKDKEGLDDKVEECWKQIKEKKEKEAYRKVQDLILSENLPRRVSPFLFELPHVFSEFFNLLLAYQNEKDVDVVLELKDKLHIRRGWLREWVNKIKQEAYRSDLLMGRIKLAGKSRFFTKDLEEVRTNWKEASIKFIMKYKVSSIKPSYGSYEDPRELFADLRNLSKLFPRDRSNYVTFEELVTTPEGREVAAWRALLEIMIGSDHYVGKQRIENYELIDCPPGVFSRIKERIKKLWKSKKY